jgi:aspartate/methionine/tyrosine aminotransferase
MNWLSRLWTKGPRILVEEHLGEVVAPANLRINDRVRELREYCRRHGCDRPYHHFAFGESPFPPPPPVVEALIANAGRHSYLPTAGLEELREAVAGYYNRNFDLGCRTEQVVVSPGSKEMISMVLAVASGPVIIPAPSWVSYLPQARIAKKRVIPVRTRSQEGFKLTPSLLARGVKHVHAKQKILILNQPHNPTGLVYTRAELEELTEVCRHHGIVVVSDEIYALTAFAPETFTSMAEIYPESTIVTGGLSKDRSCGGYRLGVGVFPRKAAELITGVLKVAGSTYSCVAAPIQHAALAAYADDEHIDAYVRDCRDVNRAVGRQMASHMAAVPGVTTTTPEGAFYLFVDFNAQHEQFLRVGLKTCAEFCDDALAVEHTAMLPASSLLLPDDEFSVRCSYVDYDGEAALQRWRQRPPQTTEEEAAFVRDSCPLILEGVQYLARYMGEVREGRRPKHLGPLEQS